MKEPTFLEPIRSQFTAARRELAAVLVDRDEEIDLALTALLAREHLLLVGPPGCGKSLLLDSLLAWAGGKKFSALLTRFSVPEELFGPISLAGLKEDRFVRVTVGKLPEADFVFLDEVFKGSSAILNTLLKILNERVFDRGDGSVQAVPLKLCVAASNEWPASETAKELAALFDRFVIRKSVTPVRTFDGRQRLLWSPGSVATFADQLKPSDLEEACASAAAMPWSAEAREALETVLRELAKEGVQPGDRRQVKTIGVVRAYTFLQGADAVLPEHLEVAAHCLWDDPTEQPEVVARVIARIANPPGMRINQLLMEAEGILADADPRDLAKAAAATAKLGEVDQRLSELATEPRVAKVRTYVRDQIRKLRLASLAAV
jgi:MoxR-like ATPase